MIHWWNSVWWWIEVHTGTVNEPGPYYGFWSGFGSDIGEATLIGAVILAFRKTNCHTKRCFRLSHHDYEMDGVTYKLCRKHHPAVNDTNRPTANHFRFHHERTHRL